jgi:hypothetical protein
MNATMRISSPHRGHASGSTSSMRLSRFAQRRFALRNASGSGSTIESIVALQHLTLIGDMAGESGQKLECIGSLTASGGTSGLVGVIGDCVVLVVVLHAAEGDGVTGAITSQSDRELLVRNHKARFWLR